jgi:threonine/homoserine/homoserine lactone efflux protein
MGSAIGQMLPIALGIAISPLPIVAVVLMLATAGGRANGIAFLAGWLLGLAVVGAIVLAVAGGVGAASGGQPATWVSVLKLVLGLLLLTAAVRQWRGRPREGEPSPPPRWLHALDTFTVPKALGAGALLSGLNPKNLLLAVAGAAGIADAGICTSQEILTYAIFVVIASIGVAAPVVISLVMGKERSRAVLDEIKAWLEHSNAAIMTVLLLVIGVKLIGDAITGFSS